MAELSYTAFYPTPPYWAGDPVSFAVPKVGTWFYDQMTQIVAQSTSGEHEIRVYRDGMVEFRISKLERQKPIIPPDFGDDAEILQRWGDYLDYANTLLLLLSSAALEIDKFALFDLHEITTRDVFRNGYKDGKDNGGGLPASDIATSYFHARFSGSYDANGPTEADFFKRKFNILSTKAIAHAFSQFEKVMSKAGSHRALATLERSNVEFQIGNFATSVILSWFVIESAISQFWSEHIEQLDKKFPDGRSRMNKDRRKFLSGRDFTASVMIDALEQFGVLSYDLFEDINFVRKQRNCVVHDVDTRISADAATKAIRTCVAVVEQRWGISVTPNLSFSYKVI